MPELHLLIVKHHKGPEEIGEAIPGHIAYLAPLVQQGRGLRGSDLADDPQEDAVTIAAVRTHRLSAPLRTPFVTALGRANTIETLIGVSADVAPNERREALCPRLHW